MRAKMVSVFPMLMVLALAVTASAQTKISGTCKCNKPDKQSVDVPDRAGHMYMIVQAKCTWTQPMELDGVQTKEGVTTGMEDVTGNTSRGRGTYVDTMANGDKCHIRFQGSSALKDGQYQSAEGTWSYAGGTGKFKGLKGKGTYKGSANADGSVTYAIDGEYQLHTKK